MRLDRLFSALAENFSSKFPNGGQPVGDRVASLVQDELEGLSFPDHSLERIQGICQVFDGMKKDTIEPTLSYARSRLGNELCR